MSLDTTYRQIDHLIQKGYEEHNRNNSQGCCDPWLEAWSLIKKIFETEQSQDIYTLSREYEWSELISNYVQDLEMELSNAGIENELYHQKRIDYCKELLKWCGTEELIVGNTRRAIAESYFRIGNKSEADYLFEEWLREDPDWGWGYIGWSDCYQFEANEKCNERAEEILLNGYTRPRLRDRIDLVDRLVSLYTDMGNDKKMKEYIKIKRSIQHLVPKNSFHYKAKPAISEKTGRNTPCICGSGKKYKRCCGA
jgi:tetratricopeptide (TPR) repeat protein